MKRMVFGKRTLALSIVLIVLLLCSGLFYAYKKDSENSRKAEMAKPDLKGKIIIIDPGHGGADPGAMVGDLKEADINMDIALELKKRFEDTGAAVRMTREGDKGLVPEKMMKYSERAEILKLRKIYANDKNGHILLSIHVNSSSEATAAGAIAFYADSGSKDLAKSIQDRISRLDRRKRKIKRSYFSIINGNTMPSVLVETGFITNEEDRLRLTERPGEIAEQIYQGVLDYMGK